MTWSIKTVIRSFYQRHPFLSNILRNQHIWDKKLLFQHLWREAFKTVIRSFYHRRPFFPISSKTSTSETRSFYFNFSILSFSQHLRTECFTSISGFIFFGMKKLFQHLRKEALFQHLGQQSFSFNLTFATKTGFHHRSKNWRLKHLRHDVFSSTRSCFIIR